MEYFNSFFQNIKDKLTNPFFGTLIIVLILHHPQFWYSLFNFDDGVNLRQKIAYLREIGSQEFSIREISNDVFCAILFVIVGYLIVLGTRMLSMWIEFRLMPMITQKIVSENLVMRTEYDEVVKERNEYSEKYEEQRKTVRLMSKDFDGLAEDSNNKNTQISELQIQITKLNNSLSQEKSNSNKWKTESESSKRNIHDIKISNETLQTGYDKLKSENGDFIEFFFGNDDIVESPILVVRMAMLKVEELKSKNLWQTFLVAGRDVSNGSITNLSAVNSMVRHKVVIIDKEGITRYRLTYLGEFLWKFREHLSEETP